jgi:3-deoxy-7-phosphoheptulonate synthase
MIIEHNRDSGEGEDMSNIRILETPEELERLHPLGAQALQMVKDTRIITRAIMDGSDPRILAIVGPCSADESRSNDGTFLNVDFAERLKVVAEQPIVKDNLVVVMRCPPAKPRSNTGRAGLEQGNLVTAHEILTGIGNTGMPLTMEIMNKEHVARYGGMLSMGWIGARDNTATKFRQTLSGSNLPVFCKNGVTGELGTALDAVKTINAEHDNVELILPDGRLAEISHTTGNQATGLVWRGGTDFLSPDAFAKGVADTAEIGQPYLIDCAHSNEQAHDSDLAKSVIGQIACFNHTLELIAGGTLRKQPAGIMIEANLLAGADTTGNTPGMSRTDPCVSFEDLEAMLIQLATSRVTLQGINV